MSNAAEKEIEIKMAISNDDAAALRKRIGEMGRVRFGDSFCEENMLFDDINSSIAKRGETLRIRCTLKKGKKSFTLTHKGPDTGVGPIKVRQESNLEMPEDLAKNFISLFGDVGLMPKFVYEKVREDYKVGKVLLSFYIFPYLGGFIEIEGSEAEIKKFCRRFGLDIGKAIMASWPEFFKEKIRSGEIDAASCVKDDGHIEIRFRKVGGQ